MVHGQENKSVKALYFIRLQEVSRTSLLLFSFIGTNLAKKMQQTSKRDEKNQFIVGY